ncbi:MAG: FAD:protein FMN transferase [Methylococcales bacterium]
MTSADKPLDLIKKRASELVLLLFFLLLTSACSDPNQRQLLTFNGSIMGTVWTVKIVNTAADELTKSEVNEAISVELQRIDHLLSTYRESSELAKFNRNPSTEWIAVSKDFVDVMAEASRISQLTHGAFDVTVAPLVNLWGFGADGNINEIPSQHAIKQALEIIGYQKIKIDVINQRLRKIIPEISVDLSAIAKGYAVDQVALLLEKLGIKEYLVEVGGELRAQGNNLANVAWKVGVEVPDHQLRQVYQAIQLVNEGIATSGDYRNYYELDGQQFAHTIDPVTARPVKHTLASVTVITNNSMQADGWATALMVLGVEKGLAVAEQQQLAVLFISRSSGSLTDRATTAFSRR